MYQNLAEGRTHCHRQSGTGITIICTWSSPWQSNLPGCWVWMPPHPPARLHQASSWTLASSSLPVSLLQRSSGPGSVDQGISWPLLPPFRLRPRPPDLVKLRPKGHEGVKLGFCPGILLPASLAT